MTSAVARSPLNTAEPNPRTAMKDSQRFATIRIKNGPCVVLDLARYRKIVATSYEPEAAEAFACLMNGEVQGAMACRDAAIAALGPPRDFRGGEQDWGLEPSLRV